tara:strand:- start:483 stop:629 length:147 start_codon:yes stop_codon:yes gene_type:complete
MSDILHTVASAMLLTVMTIAFAIVVWLFAFEGIVEYQECGYPCPVGER